MSLTIESSRFGRVEIDPDRIVEFPDGLIGLGGSRYALLASDEDSPFLWLHSLEDPDLALPVTDPARFFDGFGVELADEDAERLGLDDVTAVADLRHGPGGGNARGLQRQPQGADPRLERARAIR